LEVYRLTEPAYASTLPAHYNRAISRRNTFLLYASDRTGSQQAFRLDLKSGESRQLTEARDLDPSSLCLTPNEGSFCYFDGPVLREVRLSNLREREIYSIPGGWERSAGCSLTRRGDRVLFGEKRATGSRLRSLNLRGSQTTMAQVDWVLSHPIMHPRRDSVLCREDANGLWVLQGDRRRNQRLRLPQGGIGPACWSAEGNLLYLHFPSAAGQLNALREYSIEEEADKLIGPTSQFVHFGVNEDASVFVGASRNVASPHLLIFLRVTRRELTLCEHKASDPSIVAPVFSPGSQRIYFNSDRHGQKAIYMMRVEKFVERTESPTE
jgi:oligogalacturonide lyase